MMALRKPNEGRTNNHRKIKNQIGKQFSNEFRVLMDIGYYEGTKYAEFFDQSNENGQSNIYVKDDYEEQLKDFDDSPFNEMEFLVGLTGMGKTTLIRNYYKVFDSGFSVSKNEYVIYISFYRAELSSDKPYESLVSEMISYLTAFTEYLLRTHPEIREIDLTDNNTGVTQEVGNENNDKTGKLDAFDCLNFNNQFWIGFYDFVYGNKPTLVSTHKITPTGINISALITPEPSDDQKRAKLEELYDKNAFEYYCSLIKYILQKIGQPYKITFIFDDIESKDSCFHAQMIDIARHIFSCMNAIDAIGHTVKVLVALRAYTFRSNMERMAEARRESIRNSILKRNTVSLHDIFDVRFKAISDNRIKERHIGNLISYKNAKEELDWVENRLNKIGSDLIFNLANYNLCKAMVTYCELMVNLEWMTGNETDTGGSFTLDGNNYRVTKNNILCAVGMGNESFYDGGAEYIPNIIQFNGYGTELVCLYIIRYMIKNDLTEIYGEEYVIGYSLLDDLADLFCPQGTPVSIRRQWENNLEEAISFLYYKGILFRSLYDIENVNVGQIKREYEEEFKLYLAPRGVALYELLGDSSVLLEMYRDDIEIDLKNNERITTELSKFDTFIYVIEMLERLFGVEKQNIARTLPDIDKYVEMIGDEFIVSYMLLGFSKNMKSYYGEADENREIVVKRILSLADDLRSYALNINERYGEYFKCEIVDKIEELVVRG